MHKIVYLVLGALVAVGGVSTGCGDSDSNTGGAGGTNAGGTNQGGTNAGGTTNNGGDNTGGTVTSEGGGGSGQGGTGGGAALSCDDYCTEQLAGCTADLAQFSDKASCMKICSSYPVGKVSDMGGQETLGCRSYHTGVAAMNATNAMTHCWHGGPTGGDADNTDGTAGVCGDGCEAFCNLEKTACGFGTTGNNQYKDDATCMAACKKFPKPTAAQYTLATAPSGKDFFCYFYHLTAAATLPDTHCSHTKLGGGQCEPPPNP